MVNDQPDALIDIALNHIEKDKGIRLLSLRKIAREAGCSHVNLYHYVKNLDELVWHCYCRSMLEYRDWCSARFDARPKDEHFFVSYARAAFAFAKKRPGAYRLLWVEDLSSPPPEFALEVIERVSSEFNVLSANSFGGSRLKADLANSWLLGKLAFLASGRYLGTARAAEKEIMDGIGNIIAMLSKTVKNGQ